MRYLSLLIVMLSFSQLLPAQGQGILLDYTCNPESCLVYSTGTGYFSSGIGIQGDFYRSPTTVWSRYTATALASNGCTVDVTFTSYADSIFDPILGDGIEAHTDPTQGGPQLFSITNEQYLGDQFVIQSPVGTNAVPCV